MYQDHHNNSNLLFFDSWTPPPPPTARREWTFAEDKAFELCLVEFPEGTPDRWHIIAAKIPGKSPEEIKQHFDILVRDVYEIDAGRVPVPNYRDDWLVFDSESNSNHQIDFELKSKQQGNCERKKGTPWTLLEHKLFLFGLRKYGKGDWRSIARNVVITRSSAQVASHAQKYYLRLYSGKKARKRSSIHDITMIDYDVMNAIVERRMEHGFGSG
ncbi:Transcription factor MYB1R1 [Hibiscus syriacus]|uniref:Transcription factor MYB1R1 n=1 Tax=Hibiscus syriacus TaxID=106335 RepID=A0A6A3D885_HIBSY|nr:transcription factor DIVARICATA-like [Hibiscus syriacus]KAE8735571.1 Transcription factor MYB1R1 [Hibiscus syriacus]